MLPPSLQLRPVFLNPLANSCLQITREIICIWSCPSSWMPNKQGFFSKTRKYIFADLLCFCLFGAWKNFLCCKIYVYVKNIRIKTTFFSTPGNSILPWKQPGTMKYIFVSASFFTLPPLHLQHRYSLSLPAESAYPRHLNRKKKRKENKFWLRSAPEIFFVVYISRKVVFIPFRNI